MNKYIKLSIAILGPVFLIFILYHGYAKLATKENLYSEIGSFENVSNVAWSTDGEQYFIVFRDGLGQLYDTNNFKLSKQIKNIAFVIWSPDSKKYFVRFKDDSGQIYGADGNEIGKKINEMAWIKWSPNGSSYIFRFASGRAQLYSENGLEVGMQVQNVSRVEWSPDSKKYFITFSSDKGQLHDNKMQLYSAEGVEISLKNYGYAEWSFDSEKYFAWTIGGKGQLYNVAGNKIGSFVANSFAAMWGVNNQYAVLDTDGNIKIYDAAGLIIDSKQDIASIAFNFYFNEMFSNMRGYFYGGKIDMENELRVSWSPDGSKYVKFIFGSEGQLYSENGFAIGPKIDGVVFVDWNPNSSTYYIKFRGNLGKLYSLDGHCVSSDFKKVAMVYWNRTGRQCAIRFDNHVLKMFTIK